MQKMFSRKSCLNGYGKLVGIIGIFSILANSPAAGPVIIVATIKLLFNFVISTLVSLHMLGGHEFLKSMIGDPFFKVIS